MNLRTLRRSEERFTQRYNATVTYSDTKGRHESGPYGTTGRPKGEGRHLSGRDILRAKRFGLWQPRREGKNQALARRGLFGRAAQAVARTARRVAGAFRGR